MAFGYMGTSCRSCDRTQEARASETRLRPENRRNGTGQSMVIAKLPPNGKMIARFES